MTLTLKLASLKNKRIERKSDRPVEVYVLVLPVALQHLLPLLTAQTDRHVPHNQGCRSGSWLKRPDPDPSKPQLNRLEWLKGSWQLNTQFLRLKV